MSMVVDAVIRAMIDVTNRWLEQPDSHIHERIQNGSHGPGAVVGATKRLV
jgi:hypothetical protein